MTEELLFRIVKDCELPKNSYRLISIYKALYKDNHWVGKWTSFMPQDTVPFTENEKETVKSLFEWITSNFENGVDCKFTEYIKTKLGSGNNLTVDIDEMSFISVRFSRAERVSEYPIRLFLYRRED